MQRLAFTVLGTPAPQGSKTPWGTEANPNTRPWRATIAAEAYAARNGQPPFVGPVNLNVTFRMPRPKSHYRTGKRFAELRPDAPVFSPKKPDLDKLVRAICDSLTTAGVWRDDNTKPFTIPVPTLDGHRADTLKLAFAGSVEIDKLLNDDLEHFKSLRFGQEVELRITGVVGKNTWAIKIDPESGDETVTNTIGIAVHSYQADGA